MNHWLLIFISLVSVVSFIPFAQAAEVELQPVSDTTIKKSAPDTSFATAPSLDALYDGGTDYFGAPQDVHEAYIKFDLSALPANKYITHAKLKVTSFGESTYGFSDIRLRRVLADWSDQTTWTTRPAYAEESDATLEIANNQFPPEIDITGVVQDWYIKTIPNYGLVMRPFGDGNYQTGIYTADDAHISSKEGPNAPRLLITYSDTPPPTNTPSASPTSGQTTAPSGGGGSGSAPELGGSSQSNEVGQPGEEVMETMSYRPCDDSIRSLKAEVSMIQAKLLIETESQGKMFVYFSTTSRVDPPGATGKVASDAAQGSLRVESEGAGRNHTILLNPLQSETQYYFSLRGEGITDCEHVLKTLSSVATLRGAQGGIKNRSDIEQDSFISRVNSAAAQLLTQGKPVSLPAKSGITTLLVTLLTLGPATVTVMIAGYRSLRQAPYSILARFLKRRNRITWGRVLSSNNSRGVAHALVTLFEDKSGKIVDRTMSDQLGLYGFIADPGRYRVSVKRGGYIFPAALMPYGYQGSPFKVESQDGTVALDIPMDPLEYTNPRYHSFARVFYTITILRWPLILLGLVLSLMSLTIDLTVLNFLLLAIFGYLVWREYKHRRLTACRIHIVDSNGQHVPYVQVIIRGQGGIKRQLANSEGLTIVELKSGEYEAKITTLPITNRSQIREAQQSFQVTKPFGIQEITITFS